MQFSTSWVSATAAAVLSMRAAAAGLSISSDSDIKATAKTVAGNLLQYYKGNEKGEIPGILPGPPPSGAGDYYWWTASAMWASLVDYWHFTGDASHNDLVMKGMLWQAGDGGNYMPANWTASMGNDDQGFWGIAAMTAAERGFPDPPRDRPQWLGLARNVFQDLADRWDAEACDGGLRWQIFSTNNGYDYKNSISTGVLMHLGARLHRYTGNSTFGDWAGTAWEWSEDVGLLKGGAIYDGARTQQNCSPINKVEFSYNSGVYILGAAHMYNMTTDAKWKDRLDSVLQHGLKQFFKDGAAYESACEAAGTCTTDMAFFKGIFVQMLASAAQLAPHIADTVLPVLRTSAAAAVTSCGGSEDATCGLDWTAKSDGKANAGTACNVLSSVAPLLAKAGDAPHTAKTGGTSSGSTSTSSGNSSTSSTSNGNSTNAGQGDSGKDGKDSKNASSDKKGAASRMSGSIALSLVMACVTVLLL